MDESTPAHISPLTFDEVLTKNESMRREGLPTFTQLRSFASAAAEQDKEAGLLGVRSRGHDSAFRPIDTWTYSAVYKAGRKNMIFPPPIPYDIEYWDATAVFLHSHTIDGADQSGTSFDIFPSTQEGDLDRPEGESRIRAGGSLNIFSTAGILFYLGRTPIDTEMVSFEERHGLKKIKSQRPAVPYFLITSGVHTGLKSTNLGREAAAGMRFPEDILTLSYTHPTDRNRKHFIFVDWQHLLDTETSGINLQEIMFGNGLNTLVERLGVSIPHQINSIQAITRVIE
jgi:hypothetical protein